MQTGALSARTPRRPQSVGTTPRARNPLLTRDDIGKGKPSSYDLPETSFSYGRPGNQDYEGARDVSMRWVSHLPSKARDDAAPDFIRLNKKAATVKITNSKDMVNFRKEYNFQETARASGSQTARTYPLAKPLVPSDVIPNFTYGRKARPSTPIHEVITNRFGEKAEMEALQFNEQFEEYRATKESEIRKIPLTKASRGHASTAKKAALQVVENRDQFKLSKFGRAKPQVDTGMGKTPRYQLRQDHEQPSWDPRQLHELPIEGANRRPSPESQRAGGERQERPQA